MIELARKEDCCGCFGCKSICPESCIEMNPDSEGFNYLEIDVSRCTNCGQCNKVCPMNKKRAPKKNPKVYAAWNLDDETRLKSSSGGVFSLLAKEIIDQNGVVFGAAFDENMKLSHSFVEDYDGLNRFRGSKYIESTVGTSFIEAKAFLKEGRKVLFSGTPCQISGLKHFLKKEYDNLLTVDLVCHGVPSPEVFNKYKQNMERTHNSKVVNIEFRNKNNGWKSSAIEVEFEDGKKYLNSIRKDNYMFGFLRNIYLRPCCHECQFTGVSRIADITLGDFWGVGKKKPELDDDKGTSIVLLHSEKGSNFFEQLGERIFMEKANVEDAIIYNPAINSPAYMNFKRNRFFSDFLVLPFEKIVRKYLKMHLIDYFNKYKIRTYRFMFFVWAILMFAFALFSLLVEGKETLSYFVTLFEFYVFGLIASNSVTIRKITFFKMVGVVYFAMIAYILGYSLIPLLFFSQRFDLSNSIIALVASSLGIATTVVGLFIKSKIIQKQLKSIDTSKSD
ncbi:MAG: Coenzyme F420 hydrogenase/dehydrogenase, beta subunit C-terminal domain [Bacillota bacterium]